MEYRQPGASGLKVSAPSFGTGTFAGRTDPTAAPDHPGLGPAAHHGRGRRPATTRSRADVARGGGGGNRT